MSCYFEVRRPSSHDAAGPLLFEGLRQELAVTFAQAWFKKGGEICEIREIAHASKKFQSSVEP